MDDMLCGYTLEEIDELGAEIFQLVVEEQVPIRLAILGLCRAITMLGTDEDMDLACMMIDRLREMVAEENFIESDDFDEEEEDED
jgi:hypothetical protein